MSSLALLRPDAEPGVDLERLHVNLWCLSGLLGRSRFLLDIGLRIQTCSGGTSHLEIALPAPTDGTALCDITSDLRDQRTAELVFGGPVSVRTAGPENWLDVGTTSMRLVSINAEGSELLASTRQNSRWQIAFEKPLPPETTIYTRFRFRLDGSGSLWRSERSGLWQVGALVDVRIGDLRDSTDLSALAGRVISAEKTAYFVIAPPRLHLEHASPDLTYARVLEGRSWEGYLGCATDLGRAAKLIVYCWRDQSVGATPDDTENSNSNPFRGFLDLRRWSRLGSIGSAGALMIAALAAVALLSDPDDVKASLLAQWLKDVWEAAGRWIVGLGLVGFVLFIANQAAKARNIFPKVRRIAHRVEDWVYRLRIG